MKKDLKQSPEKWCLRVDFYHCYWLGYVHMMYTVNFKLEKDQIFSFMGQVCVHRMEGADCSIWLCDRRLSYKNQISQIRKCCINMDQF